jgi:hypothetical protein
MILRWLISAIGLAALKGEASSIARRVGRRAIVVALLALVWVTAGGFALGALAVWLSGELGVIAACAIIAAGLAVIGLGIQLALVLGARRQAPSRFSVPLADLGANAKGTLLPDGADLSSMALLGIIGYLLGRQLFRR